MNVCEAYIVFAPFFKSSWDSTMYESSGVFFLSFRNNTCVCVCTHIYYTYADQLSSRWGPCRTKFPLFITLPAI